MKSVYHIRDLTKIYKGSQHKANDCLSLDIREGEIFGLLGPNGAGKSTLVNQMAGLIKPTSGVVQLFDSIDVAEQPTLVAQYVALQPQVMQAVRNLYPFEALHYTAQVRGLSVAVAKRQANDLMEELGIDTFQDRLVRYLSGGQQKLVGLALAFIGNRPIMMFDEPTDDLDPRVRRVIWDKLLKLNRSGTTIILVTHNVLEAERIIERVGIINHGQLLAIGTPADLKNRVDQRVRFELLLKPDKPAPHELLGQLGEAQQLATAHWVVLCRRNTTTDAINRIVTQIGLEQLDDFRIMLPSLEDVYLQLGGGQKLA